eukprot:scaffold3288_cov33-Phaeocystis_antarctica.AAC.1
MPDSPPPLKAGPAASASRLCSASISRRRSQTWFGFGFGLGLGLGLGFGLGFGFGFGLELGFGFGLDFVADLRAQAVGGVDEHKRQRAQVDLTGGGGALSKPRAR